MAGAHFPFCIFHIMETAERIVLKMVCGYGSISWAFKCTIHEWGIACCTRMWVHITLPPMRPPVHRQRRCFTDYIFSIILPFYGIHIFLLQRSHLSRWCTTDVKTSVKERMAALLSPDLSRHLCSRGQNVNRCWETPSSSKHWLVCLLLVQAELSEWDTFKICSLASLLLLER